MYDRIKEALAFDDVLIEPEYSTILPSEVGVKTLFTRNVSLNVPLISAAMDTVTEHAMAIAMAQAGGIGVIHKNLSIQEQADEVKKVKRYESGMVVDPVTMHPDDTLGEARSLMSQHQISGIPVVERGTRKLVGIITNRDVRFANDLTIKVYDLMTKENLITVSESVTTDEAKCLLHQHRIEKLMVVDSNYKCVGLITVKDIDKAQNNPLGNKDNQGRLRVAAAVGVGPNELDRAKALISAGVDVLVIDTAHGHSAGVVDAVGSVKKLGAYIDIVAGNVATPHAAIALIGAGADAIKIGIGPGCFVPGSLVITRRGKVTIEEVVIGDEVLTHTGQWKSVTNLFTFNDKKEIIHVNEIACTPNHEFYVLHKSRVSIVSDENIHMHAEWIAAENLSSDYLLIRHTITKKSKMLTQYELVEIEPITKCDYHGATYDLEVADDHSYNIEGIVVHNSICSTRVVAGIGIPQFSAILETSAACLKKEIPCIADGGIRSSGDVVKALAAGANSVMIGSMLAGTDESPGESFIYQGRAYKAYRGMGSLGAMIKGSADRYNQTDVKLNKMVPEGVEAQVPARGPVGQVLHQLVGGLRSGMGYVGAADISQLQNNARFRRITNAGLTESKVHDVLITKEAPNYSHN